MLVRVVLCAIVLAALALRLALVLPQVHSAVGYLLVNVYGSWGFNLAKFGRWQLVEDNVLTGLNNTALERKTNIDPADLLRTGFDAMPADNAIINFEQPGPGYFIGLIWWLTSDYRYVHVLLAQALLDALASLLAYVVGARIWGRVGGVFGALAYALFLPQAQLTAYVLYNAWVGPFLLLLLVCILNMPLGRRGLIRNGILGGFVVGAGTLFAPTFLPMLFAGVAQIGRVGWKGLTIWLGVGYLTVAAILLPWSVRNSAMHGEFRPVASAFWWGIYYGLVEQDDSPFGPHGALEWPNDEGEVIKFVKERFGPTKPFTREYEAHMRTLVFEAFARDPIYFPKVAAARLAATLLFAHLTADMSLMTKDVVLKCYEVDSEGRPTAASQAWPCDPVYGSMNPWPKLTADGLNFLYWIMHLGRLNVIELPYYGPRFSGPIIIGLPIMAAFGIIIALLRRRYSALILAAVALAWICLYAINHIEPRYVAGAQALLAISALGGIGAALGHLGYLVQRQWRLSAGITGSARKSVAPSLAQFR